MQTDGVNVSGVKAALQGMGGVGKTALAVALAHRVKDGWPDAQILLNLRGADPERRPPLSPAEALQSIIYAFHPDAKLPESLEALRTIFLSVLQEDNRRILLLLDNAAGSEQIEPLLPPPNCLLLVTSRAHFTLPGLVAKDIGCLKPEQSMALLNKLAPRIENHAARAAEMCGHLPLALEVFAGVINDKQLYPMSDLLQRFESKQEKLTKVEAAFEVSYELQPKPLRDHWCQLAIFPGSFDLLAIAAVWGIEKEPARAQLQLMINASLVERYEETERFRLHDLIRQFCDGKLSSAHRNIAQVRHAMHYYRILSEAEKLFLQGNDASLRGLSLFDSERSNIETGYDFAARHASDNKPAAKLCIQYSNAGVYISELRHHARQRIKWLEASLTAAKRLGSPAAQVNALGNLGIAYKNLGEFRRSIEYYEQTLAISSAANNRRLESIAFGNLGVAYGHLGDNGRALEYQEKHLTIAREIGDRRGEASALANLAGTYARLNELHRAIEFYELAKVSFQALGDRRGEGNVLANLGSVHALLGEPRRAIEFYQQRLVIAREIGDRRGEANALGNLGNSYETVEGPLRAIESYEQAIVISREIGNRHGEGIARWNLSLVLKALGRRPEAIAQATSALGILEQIEDPNTEKVRRRLADWRSEK